MTKTFHGNREAYRKSLRASSLEVLDVEAVDVDAIPTASLELSDVDDEAR